MKEKIIAWLQGPRNFAAGAALYEQYGANLMLKASFRRQGDTLLTRATLLEELRKLAGLTEQQLCTLPRLAVASEKDNRQSAEERAAEAEERAADAESRTDEAESRASDAEGRAADAEKRAAAGQNTPASDELKEMVSFRDRYPFLREPDCPDVLKVLTADLFAAYDRYRDAHAALVVLPDDAMVQQAERLAAEAVENYLQDRSILDELVHYRDHGTLLGRHPRVAAAMQSTSLKNKTDLEVENIRKNAASNASKWRKKLEQCTPGTDDYTRCADYLQRWELTRQEAEQELESRKKNA